MQSLFSHHAYIIEHDVTTGCDALLASLEHDEGVVVRGNPDIWREEYDVFGIDDARMLQEIQSRKALQGGRKIIIVGFQSITHEAQNALLKVFEEPTAHTHFFIITPSSTILLPTVRSRLSTASLDTSNQVTQTDMAEKFLKSSFSARQELIAPLLEAKDKGKSIELVNALEALLYARYIAEGDSALGVFEELQQARGYLRDRAPSVKIILEHIALVVPTL